MALSSRHELGIAGPQASLPAPRAPVIRRGSTPTGFVLSLGLGLIGAAILLPLAFNAPMRATTLLATPAFALGAALCVAALPLGSWRGGSLAIRTAIASACFAALVIANPAQQIHSVAQAMWGLSDGWGDHTSQ